MGAVLQAGTVFLGDSAALTPQRVGKDRRLRLCPPRFSVDLWHQNPVAPGAGGITGVFPIPRAVRRPLLWLPEVPHQFLHQTEVKGKIDGLLADEFHQYTQDSGQGDAMAEIAGTAKKVVGMTATLINGYASGIFHLLFRLTPAEMVADGQSHADPQRFCRKYGVVESTYEVRAAEYNANRWASRAKKGEQMLPGVSPLVYSRFLLENTVFLSLMDMGKDLPEYEEIPVGLTMCPEVRKEYQSLSEQFLSLLRSKRGAARKLLFTLRQASRRSWRINQTAPRVDVYFFYYRDTIQERAMQLMASNFGTDLQTAIRCEMQGDVETGGAAVVNAQLLTGVATPRG